MNYCQLTKRYRGRLASRAAPERGVKEHMKSVARILEHWEKTHRKSVDLGELISRNPIAHKWKCTYRVTVLRELAFWRTMDIVKQIALLAEHNHLLGARILLRSAIETVSVLFYLNMKMLDVVERRISLDDFGEITSRLMLGSKYKTTVLEAVNVLTIITKHCEGKYPGISDIYASLSESAHPNYEGMCSGYSTIDETKFITYFENRWASKYLGSLENAVVLGLHILEIEYNELFIGRFEALEHWLVDNDSELEILRAAP